MENECLVGKYLSGTKMKNKWKFFSAVLGRIAFLSRFSSNTNVTMHRILKSTSFMLDLQGAPVKCFSF